MNESERIERAKRLQQMREGDRNDDGETAAGTDAAVDADATDDAPAETTDDMSAPLPDGETLEAAVEDDGVETSDTGSADEPAPGPAGVADETTTHSDEETRVLEFELEGERYCLDIEYVEEIVEQEAVTRVPNTPAFVEGVVDLRGQITTIVNPKEVLEKEKKDASDLIIVFDTETFEDQGHIGWVVDDVHQVAPVTENQVNDSPMEQEYINGIIDRGEDEEFVIWTTPELIFDATG